MTKEQRGLTLKTIILTLCYPPQYLTFRIPKIWYKNEWYWLAFLLTSGFIGFWLYRKQEQRKRAFAQLRVQAIANQLNPFLSTTPSI